MKGELPRLRLGNPLAIMMDSDSEESDPDLMEPPAQVQAVPIPEEEEPGAPPAGATAPGSAMEDSAQQVSAEVSADPPAGPCSDRG
jgi:hypothetical protein